MDKEKWTPMSTHVTSAIRQKSIKDVQQQILCNLDVLFSQFTNNGSYRTLAWSPHSILAFAPPRVEYRTYDEQARSAKHGFRYGGLDSHRDFALAVMMPQYTQGNVRQFTRPIPIAHAAVVHANTDIQHLAWNQKGTCLASIDDGGHLGLWAMGNLLNQWNCLLNLNLDVGVACFEWLKTDREYAGTTVVRRTDGVPRFGHRFKRVRFVGPRNAYGHLAFVIVSVDGRIQLWYQTHGRTFSNVTCHLPSNPDRISHASMAVGAEGKYILSIHRHDVIPKAIDLFELAIDLVSHDKSLECRHITSFQIASAPIQPNDVSSNSEYPSYMLTKCPITHLRALSAEGGQKYRVLVTVSEKTEPSHYICPETARNLAHHSFVAIYELSKLEISLVDTFSELACRKKDLARSGAAVKSGVSTWSCRYSTGYFFDWGMVTAVLAKGKDIVFGFCNGRIDFRDMETLKTAKTQLQMKDSETIDSITNCGFTFSNTAAPSCLVGEEFAILDLTFSPNDTALIYAETTGKLDIASVADMHPPEEDIQQDTPILIAVLARMFSTAVLNNVDHTDLVDISLRLADYIGKKDFIEDVLEALYAGLDALVREETDGSSTAKTPNPNDSKENNTSGGPIPGEGVSTLLARLNGVQMSLFRAAKGKDIQYANTLAMIQLRTNVEAFRDSCASDSATIKAVIEDGGNVSLRFRPETVWPLIGLTSWTIDLCAFLIRDLHTYFSRYPDEGGADAYSSEPPHFVLLLQNSTRKALQTNLRFITQLEKWANDTMHLDNDSNVSAFASKCLHNARSKCPVNLEVMLRFIEQVDTVVEQAWPGLTAANLALRERRIAVRGVIPTMFRAGLFQTLRNAFESQSDLYDKNALFFYDASWLGLSKVDMVAGLESGATINVTNGQTPKKSAATPASSGSLPSPALVNGVNRSSTNVTTPGSRTGSTPSTNAAASSVQNGHAPNGSSVAVPSQSGGETPATVSSRDLTATNGTVTTPYANGYVLSTDVIRKQRLSIDLHGTIETALTTPATSSMAAAAAMLMLEAVSSAQHPTRQCIKCGQASVVTMREMGIGSVKEQVDLPLWYDAYARTCVCGGMWKLQT